MTSTTIVKAPVIPQWSDIVVTAPSVTNIPLWFYDWTETITANAPVLSIPIWFMRDTPIDAWLYGNYSWYSLTLYYKWKITSFFVDYNWNNAYSQITSLDLTTKLVSPNPAVNIWLANYWFYLDWNIVHINSDVPFSPTFYCVDYNLDTLTVSPNPNPTVTTWIPLTATSVVEWGVTYSWRLSWASIWANVVIWFKTS